MNNSEYRQPTHREELERELVHGASSQIAHAPENAAAIAKGIKTVLDELAPVAPHPVALSAPPPALDHGPDSLERAWEYKTYQDGTTAFGPAPLPDVSPALWAKPLAKEVPELTVSLSDLGLERVPSNVVLAIGGNMTTEVVHSLVAECAESALTPTSPGSAVWEPQEHEYVLPHVGQPHSAFRETEGERRSRLSAQRIAQSSARLLQGN